MKPPAIHFSGEPDRFSRTLRLFQPTPVDEPLTFRELVKWLGGLVLVFAAWAAFAAWALKLKG